MGVGGTLGLLILASTGLQVSDVSDVSAEWSDALVAQLRSALSRRDPEGVVEVSLPPGCESDLCIKSKLDQVGADRLVIVRAYGGMTRIEVVLDLVPRSGLKRRIERPLPASVLPPADQVDALIEALWPPAPEPHSASVLGGVDAPGPPIATWALAGAGVVAVAVGLVFVVRAESARAEVDEAIFLENELRDRPDDLARGRTIAGICFSGAALAFVGALLSSL